MLTFLPSSTEASFDREKKDRHLLRSNQFRSLDLFSGIGGFALGLEATGAFRTVGFSEVEPFCCKVLARRWPDVPNFGDVRELKFDGDVDIITGGFPCQDISLANSGSMPGIYGEKSGLWFEFYAQIERHRPSWAVIENSSVLRSRGLDRMLDGLSKIGYDAEWHCIPATAVDAPHSRDRLYVIAYPAGLGDRLPEGQVLTGRHFLKHFPGRQAEPAICRVADGLPRQSHRLKSLGNAVVPQIANVIGEAICEAHDLT